MYEALRRSAADSVRSLTAEINELLIVALTNKEKATGPALESSPVASEQ